MERPPDPDAPREFPPPPQAQPTDRWALDPGAIVPGRPGGPVVDDAPHAGRRRRGRRTLAIALGALVVLAAAGGAAAFFVLRGSTAALLERVPADVDAVTVVYLDPSASQKVNLARIADAFPGVGGTDGAGERLEEWGDQVLADTGLRYDDVTAWLGVEVAAAVDVVEGTPQVALIADVADRDGAERMLAKLRAPGSPWEDAAWSEREHEGVTLSIAEEGSDVPSYAFDADALIMTSDPALLERVIDTERGTRGSIASASSFVDAEAELPDGRLMVGYVDMASIIDGVRDVIGADLDDVPAEDLADLEAIRGVAMSLSAEPDGVAFDLIASYDPGKLSGALREQVMAPDGENELLGSVPSEAWGVFGAQHLDLGIRDAIEQLEAEDPAFAADLREAGLTGTGGLLDVLSGDLAILAAPDDTTTVGGALLLGVSDEGASRDAVERVAETVASMVASDAPAGTSPTSLVWTSQTHDDGTAIRWARDLPVAYAIRDRTLVIGTSVEQVEGVLDAASEGSLIDDPAYERGMKGVPASDVSFFVDVGRVLESIREALPAEERDAFNEEVGQELRAIRSVAFGVDMTETRQRFRLFVAIPSADGSTA
jgi:hypothetical protein